MSTTTHIYGASDDLIEIVGAISEELYASHDRPDIVSVEVAADDGTRHEVMLRVEYDVDGIWRIAPETHPELVAITPARGDGEPDDADGCPGYSDKATLEGVLSAHLVSREGDR